MIACLSSTWTFTCEQARRREQRAAAVAAKSVDDSKLLRCGYCDGLGHNRRTCPVLKVCASGACTPRVCNDLASTNVFQLRGHDTESTHNPCGKRSLDKLEAVPYNLISSL